MTLLDDEIRDDDLDRRLRDAMSEIAMDYRPADNRLTAAPTQRQFPMRWTAVAAAVTIVAGSAGIWVVGNRAAAPVSSPTTVPQAPTFGENFTIPEVQMPEFGVRLDRSLLDEGLPMQNPYASWVHSQESRASRWFVSVDGVRALGWILYSDESTSNWPEFDDLPTWDGAGAADLDIRLAGDGSAVMRHGDLVRRVSVTGATVGLPTAMNAAGYVDELATLDPPPGYVELDIDRYDSWQFGDWQVGIVSPPADQFDVYLSAWAVGDAIEEPIEAGYIAPPFDGDEQYRVVVGVDDRVIVVNAPPDADRSALENLASLVELVPAGDLETVPLFTLDGIEPIERERPAAGGEVGWGRWLAVDATRPTETDNVRYCLVFIGAMENLDGCTDPGSATLTACGAVDANLGRFALATTELLSPSDVTAEADGEPVGVTVESSGGLTFVTATVDSAPDHVQFKAGREILCTT